MRLYEKTQDITAADMKAFLEKLIATGISNLRFVFQYNIECHDILAGRTVTVLLFHVFFPMFFCSLMFITTKQAQDKSWTRSS